MSLLVLHTLNCSHRSSLLWKTRAFDFLYLLVAIAGLSAYSVAQASEDSDLAQELTNPLASIITIPIQVSFDNDIGLNDQGSKITTNIQPVIPFEVNADWNLITRTIIPVIYQDDIFPGQGSQSGLGDINLSLFFSPKKPTAGGVIWGIGPVLLLPTATDDLIGSEKWGAGPAVVVLKMIGNGFARQALPTSRWTT